MSEHFSSNSKTHDPESPDQETDKSENPRDSQNTTTPSPDSSKSIPTANGKGGPNDLRNKNKKRRLRKYLTKDEGYYSTSSTPKSLAHKVVLLSGTSVSTLPGQVSATDSRKLPDLADGTLTENASEDGEGDDRPTWGKKADFLLSIIGFAVDLANVWRFPYLCYKNGGGVFLIPYLLMLVFGAMPLFYMELALGQYNRLGPISVWKICPLFKGVGYCAVLISWYVSFYYNVIIGWTVYFIYKSFSSELPWMKCGNEWNTNLCSTGGLPNSSDVNSTDLNVLNKTSPALEFFDREVLEVHLSTGFHDLGAPRWQLVICVFIVFLILYLSLFKGVKSSGKVVWVTATAPYIILTILLLRGVLLPGAINGMNYYLRPDVHKLLDSQVWIDAAVQVFYSVGVGFGVHLTYASYNKFHNNCYRDCLLTTAINSSTSFFSGFVIFVYLGYMAERQGVPINKVATEGHGLVFQVYPEAIATLPGAPFWAVLFFFMLLTLGLDSAMGGLESVITGLLDEFHTYFTRWRFRREIFTAVIISVSFIIGMVNVTRGGGYTMYWFDTYSAGISLLCSALLEAIGVAWFYGLANFCEDIHEMLGFSPGLFWRLCWKFISPFFLVAVIASAVATNAPLVYHNYRFPGWAVALGWSFALSSVTMVPVVACYKLFKARGTCTERLAKVITPEQELEQQTDKVVVNQFHLSHWVYV
uniref:Transporter n=2 Tax=Limulus polyphemus TaxID=6850 RepID=U5TBR5_LIMPO|nr:high-affinity octopamine transporter protein 1 [Limulus polyphemus]